MADFNAAELPVIASDSGTADALGATQRLVVAEVLYRMRALADPGPGYVHWTSTGFPDFTGVGAGSAIQAGTVVQVASWSK